MGRLSGNRFRQVPLRSDRYAGECAMALRGAIVRWRYAGDCAIGFDGGGGAIVSLAKIAELL
jgi:hypothetical protein